MPISTDGDASLAGIVLSTTGESTAIDCLDKRIFSSSRVVFGLPDASRREDSALSFTSRSGFGRVMLRYVGGSSSSGGYHVLGRLRS